MAKEGETKQCPKCLKGIMTWTHIEGADPNDSVSDEQAWICGDCDHRDPVGIRLRGVAAWPESD